MNMRRIGNLTPRIIATLAVLAMIIAPLCAPFFGAHACANSLAKHGDDCHSSSSADYEVPQTGVASNPVCGSSETPSAGFYEATKAPHPGKQRSAGHADAKLLRPAGHTIRCPIAKVATKVVPPGQPSCESDPFL